MNPFLQTDPARRVQWDGGPFYRDLWQWDFTPAPGYQCNIYDAADVLQPQYMEPPAAGRDMGILKAWATTRGAGQVVAIADSGCDVNHPDLAGRILFGSSAYGGQWDVDSYGHGTNVASVVAAMAPETSLFIVQCSYVSREMPAIVNAAIIAGASVLVMSWGFSEDDAAAKAALIRAGDAGIVVVCAAFNAGIDEGSQPDYPIQWQLPNVVACSSSTMDDVVYPDAAFSNTLIHLHAPGRLIIVARTSSGDYCYSSGTSLAVPKVAGALALIHAAHPALSPVERINRLLVSVDRLPSYAGKSITGGRLNVGWAVTGPELSIAMGAVPTVTMKGPVGALFQLDHSTDLIAWNTYPLIRADDSGVAVMGTENLAQEFFRLSLVRPDSESPPPFTAPDKSANLSSVPQRPPIHASRI